MSTSSVHVQPTKLFIGGISRRTTTKQLRDHFSKSGRVLDCVAMRTPDGRPRGFGYVTLDSPAAAERLLAEPQVIDDRIVDMKRAVPESQSAKVGPALALPTGMVHPMPMSMQAMYSQPNMFYGWPDESGFYCDSGYGCLNLPDMTAQPSMGADSVLDCVHLLTSGLLPESHYDLPAQKKAPAAPQAVKVESSTAAKVPLGEVTNTFNNRELIAAKKNPATTNFYALESSSLKPEQPPCIAIGVLSPLGSSDGEPCFVYEDEQASPHAPPPSNSSPTASGASRSPVLQPQDADHEKSSAVSTGAPSEAGDLSPEIPSVAAAEQEANANSPLDADDKLPSAGSALHAIGECRRCNFFAKGRCRNGFDCVFCHLPHERRKLSRQEKREQQAARQNMLMQGGLGSMDDAGSDDSEAESPTESMSNQKVGLLLSPMKAAVPPGLRPADTSASAFGVRTEPLAEPSPMANSALSTTPAGNAGPGLPPGLRPPGLPAPPQAARPQTCISSTSCPKAGLGQPSAVKNFFPAEAAATGGSSGPLLATNPRGDFLLATNPPPLAQAPGSVKAGAKPEMRTVETQTDDDYTCPYCKDGCHGCRLGGELCHAEQLP
jgi:hypothetical protein